MNLVRKLKINKLTPVEFNDFEKEILKFIDDNLSNLIAYETSLYVDYTFYMKKEGICMLAQRKDAYRNLLTNNDGVHFVMVRSDMTRVLRSYYCMKDKDIEAVVKWKVSQLLNEDKSCINPYWHGNHIAAIEDCFKREKALFN